VTRIWPATLDGHAARPQYSPNREYFWKSV